MFESNWLNQLDKAIMDDRRWKGPFGFIAWCGFAMLYMLLIPVLDPPWIDWDGGC